MISTFQDSVYKSTKKILSSKRFLKKKHHFHVYLFPIVGIIRRKQQNNNN